VAWGNAVFLAPLPMSTKKWNGPMPPVTPCPPTMINGLRTCHGIQSNGWSSYEVPSLDVLISVHGTAASSVVRTLTRSPATVVLASGPVPQVPTSWRWLRAGPVDLAVPADWPTSTSDVEGPGCGAPVYVALKDVVVLDSDTFAGWGMSCPSIPLPPPVPREPTDGLVVDLHPFATGAWPPSEAIGPCTELRGATACPVLRSVTVTNDRTAEIDMLFVEVTVRGYAGHELLEIGLGSDGTVARTILYSLRAA
jgi:hypothetical protein